MRSLCLSKIAVVRICSAGMASFVLASCAAGAVASPARAPSSTGAEKSGHADPRAAFVQLSISTDRVQYTVGEPVPVLVSIKNIGPFPLGLVPAHWEYGISATSGGYGVSLTRYGTQFFAEPPGVIHGCDRFGRLDSQKRGIGPGESLTLDLDVGRLVDLTVPGEYDIAVSYRLGDVQGLVLAPRLPHFGFSNPAHGARAPRALRPGLSKPSTGGHRQEPTVKSNALRIHVVETRASEDVGIFRFGKAASRPDWPMPLPQLGLAPRAGAG